MSSLTAISRTISCVAVTSSGRYFMGKPFLGMETTTRHVSLSREVYEMELEIAGQISQVLARLPDDIKAAANDASFVVAASLLSLSPISNTEVSWGLTLNLQDLLKMPTHELMEKIVGSRN